ncbi:MAG: class I SAM-dependent methyltransferase [Planctomycetes bacterium]|nr:class I SAM-dependent methyltransferase [Planctomycetota bacterium]
MTEIVDSASPGLARASSPPDRQALEQVFTDKFGPPERRGWGPRMRARFGYHTPDEHYEATVAALVGAGTRWLDVGCGRELLPNNRELARRLAGTAARLVGVDPDVTLEENTYVHEKVRLPFDHYETGERFDLLTLRMVAEHVEHPGAVADTIARLLAPGGRVVIYTVYRWSPVPLITSLVPFSWRHGVKRFLWRTEAKDTFPTCFRMNTRGTLRRLFEVRGLQEEWFALVDDCRSLARFKAGLWTELTVRRLCRAVGLGYPERCVLGVYRRPLEG